MEAPGSSGHHYGEKHLLTAVTTEHRGEKGNRKKNERKERRKREKKKKREKQRKPRKEDTHIRKQNISTLIYSYIVTISLLN